MGACLKTVYFSSPTHFFLQVETYLQNDGLLEVAFAGHESSRTTGLYDSAWR